MYYIFKYIKIYLINYLLDIMVKKIPDYFHNRGFLYLFCLQTATAPDSYRDCKLFINNNPFAGS